MPNFFLLRLLKNRYHFHYNIVDIYYFPIKTLNKFKYLKFVIWLSHIHHINIAIIIIVSFHFNNSSIII